MFYAFEDRSLLCILGFAGGCVASSVYGFLQGAWPFGVIEIAWTLVAIRRWMRVTGRVAIRTSTQKEQRTRTQK